MKVQLAPVVLRWARERAGLSRDELAAKMGLDARHVQAWEATGELTFARAQKLAKCTHTPFGQLYVPEPPIERLQIPDFRTVADAEVRRPSPELIDVLDDALQRLHWYREYMLAEGGEPLEFVGSLDTRAEVIAAADRIRAEVPISVVDRAQSRTWEVALAQQIEATEASGVLVMRSGIVRSNTHRPLAVEEFRGFAIADPVAPLIFINGRDALAAQMFSLAHELVHIFLGASGVSNLERTYAVGRQEERFCNRVAAELLVPEAALRAAWREADLVANRVDWLVRRFKVSSLVALRRMRDLDLLEAPEFDRLYAEQMARFRAAAEARASGGDFYRTQSARSGYRFARALIGSTLEGRTSYREAYQLLGIRKSGTFNEFARQLGFAA